MAKTDRERLIGNASIARQLSESGALRPGLTVERATDMIWVLFSPEVIFRLTTDRGWSFDETETWLTNQLCAALLQDPGPPDADVP